MAKKIPLRQCIGCRESKPKNELIRIIRTPENDICFDKTGRMNGRGAYICPSELCLDKAIKSKGIERALNCEIPDEIFEMLRGVDLIDAK
ncbi:MAG: YlxR family protein [Lachnospiraceae bacterium]|nr:YlxR family protein [Lachnospiraceae bacterium]